MKILDIVAANTSLAKQFYTSYSGGSDNSLLATIGTIINVILGLVGLVAVAVMILGGFQYITSAGDTAKVTKAKNTILYGVVGLVIAVLAYAIVNFVLSTFLGA